MFKTILLFVKAHAVATTIVTTVVVGTAIATPIIVENYKLNKKMIFIHLPGLSKITDIQNLANIFNEIGDLQWQKNT